ncbi:hypothetical protein HNQ60_000696 [Povalibacter uvarum]|uniref:Uncharacterized protein n=1 Tax=Povalibacter uvarum TaxID=732238 RepID=A0A841HHR0_9GAMM|nr:hypothetical protein [Povalibacter uvarum]
MQVPDLPPEICALCRASTPDHWLHDLFNYCPHTRTAVIRRRTEPGWTVQRGVSKRKAGEVLKLVEATFAKLAAKHGNTSVEHDRLVQRVRNADIRA